MSRTLFFSSKLGVFFTLLVIYFTLFSTNSFSQCAGNDPVAPISICDIPNISSQTINLFSYLGGSPLAGGTWQDNDLSGGLNVTTGILNAQSITQSGTFTYTYTVTGVAGCTDNNSIVTIIIGGFAGVTGPNAVVCSDSGTFNLFQVFNGSSLSPQFNGTWFNVTNNSVVAGNSINIASLGIGTFQFTYTIPAIGSCPVRSSTAFVTVYRAPVAGTPNDLLLCNTDNLATYSNLDLNNLLVGEDSGGRWTDVTNPTTGQITFLTDHNVNVQTIYNTFGPGTYSFTYTVLPSNPICDRKTSTVKIIIEKQLDFTGATLIINSDICESSIPTAVYTATLTQGAQPIPNGQYNVTYQVNGPNGATVVVLANFNSGVLTFPVSSTFFQSVGSFTVTITKINAFSSLGACVNIVNNLFDILNVFPKPNINSSNLTVLPICQNQSAVAQLTNLSSLANGSYLITYNLSGSNIANAQTVVITVAGGISNFTIPASLIPLVGNTSVTITNIVNLTSTCANAATLAPVQFEIKPLPVVSSLSVTVNSICAGQPLVVVISGLGTLSNITIDYVLSGLNTSTNQMVIFPVTGGIGSFIIPQTLVPNNGITTITVTDLINTGNSCGVIVSNGTRNFSINPNPLAPISSNRVFCKTDNATIANLLPSGSQYQWFDSATSTTVLAPTTQLVTGNYYIREVNAITGCQSPRTMVSVVVNTLNTPTLSSNGEQFCGLNAPTLQQLSANTSTTNTLLWYNAASGGTQLPSTTLLQEGVTYFGFDFSTTLNCSSPNGLAVTVTLTLCPIIDPGPGVDPVIVGYDFYIPDGFSPNEDGINDFFTIPNIEFIFPNYTLDIFNRYGSLLFSGDKNKPKWDGKSSESPSVLNGIVPNGVYFYIVNYNRDKIAPKQGRIYLNR